MHGVKRPPKTAATAEARAARKAKEAAKLQSYLDVERTFFAYKREARKDATALQHTTTLLTLNPELYTVWNYRREILLHMFAQGAPATSKPDVFADLREAKPAAEGEGADKDREEEEERRRRREELLEDDLMLTEHALRAHPKVYWIWNHRQWCLTQYPPRTCSSSASTPADDAGWVWERELKLVEKMLDLDPRNFHGWNCRRAIIHHLALSILASHPSLAPLAATQPSFPALLSHHVVMQPQHQRVGAKLLALAERELGYTLRKIEANFSNFSAWHQRTKLLPHVWAARRLSTEQVDTQLDSELELVKQAMYTDPADQSVWFYHRWLIDLLLAPPSNAVQEPHNEPQRAQRRRSILQDEIDAIEQLFELEPESKWCAISLAHLHTRLAALYPDQEKANGHKGKANTLLHKLIDLDPDRSARYRDLLEGKAHF